MPMIKKFTKAAIDAMDGPVVLVGHSYGGSIITEAGNHPRVKGERWFTSPPLRLDVGEVVHRLSRPCRKPPRRLNQTPTATGWIDQDQFAADFAADIPPAQAHFMAIAQVPISTDAFTHKVMTPSLEDQAHMVHGGQRRPFQSSNT